MRVGINLLYLLPGIVGGTETYAAGLLHGLAATAPEVEFIVFVNHESAEWPLPTKPNFTRVVCPVQGTNRGARYFFEQVRLPGYLQRYRVDLVHSLGYVGPLYCPCPSILTIPDSNYVDLAHTMPLHRRLPLRLLSTQAAKNANEIITISSFSKARLVKLLQLPASRINVTVLAPRPEVNGDSSSGWSELCGKYKIREPYLVAFAGGAVHKNIPALLDAFISLCDRYPHSLVLIGHLPRNVDLSTQGRTPGSEQRIIATGYVPGDHIQPLLTHADLFVFPSLYEGFGLPVLEAQHAGTPVACSTAGSLPEVAGDGALFFDPYSVSSIASAMESCLSNLQLREMLRQKGHDNLQRFSWEKTAVETLAVYRKAMGSAV